MMLELPERVLFAARSCRTAASRVWPAAVNAHNWLASLRQAAAPGPRFIIPGHGKPSVDAAEAIAFTDSYIRFVHNKMNEAVSN